MNLHSQDTVLAVVPGSCPGSRLVVRWIHAQGTSQIQLCQQSWGEGVGWYNQQSVELDPAQVGQLRSVLSGREKLGPDVPVRPDALDEPGQCLEFPRVGRAESA